MIISPKDIALQVRKWEKQILLSLLTGDDFFPKAIRFSKIKTADIQKHYDKIHDGLLLLKTQSKNEIGKGYWIHWVERNNQQIGRNSCKNEFDGVV